MGKALEAAVGTYNQFVGSLETQVMTQARRFEELEVDHEGKDDRRAASRWRRPSRPLAKLAADETPPTLSAEGRRARP